MAIYAKVRRMRLRDGLSITEIARRTSLSRNTIKAWLRGPVRSERQLLEKVQNARRYGREPYGGLPNRV